MSRQVTLRIEISQPKSRLDKFLHKKFPDTSRSTFQRLIENGDVQGTWRDAMTRDDPT